MKHLFFIIFTCFFIFNFISAKTLTESSSQEIKEKAEKDLNNLYPDSAEVFVFNKIKGKSDSQIQEIYLIADYCFEFSESDLKNWTEFKKTIITNKKGTTNLNIKNLSKKLKACYQFLNNYYNSWEEFKTAIHTGTLSKKDETTKIKITVKSQVPEEKKEKVINNPFPFYPKNVKLIDHRLPDYDFLVFQFNPIIAKLQKKLKKDQPQELNGWKIILKDDNHKDHDEIKLSSADNKIRVTCSIKTVPIHKFLSTSDIVPMCKVYRYEQKNKVYQKIKEQLEYFYNNL